jgi:hypothetical protein
MPNAASPFAEQDLQFNELLINHPGVKFVALIRKRQEPIVWLCTPTSGGPLYADVWGAGKSPLEALCNLVKRLGSAIQNEARPTRKKRGSISHAKAPRDRGLGVDTGERGGGA